MESKSDCHDNPLIPPPPTTHLNFTLLFLSSPQHPSTLLPPSPLRPCHKSNSNWLILQAVHK